MGSCVGMLVSIAAAFFVPKIVAVFFVAFVAWLFWRACKKWRYGRIFAVAIFAAIGALLLTAELRARQQNARIESVRSSIETAFGSTLKPGDGPEQIERVFKTKGIAYAYSDLLHEYYASVGTGVRDCEIHVTVQVDAQKRFLAVTVERFDISS